MINAKGHGGSITYNGRELTITHGPRHQTNQIPITLIASIQYKPAGIFSNGYIRPILTSNARQRTIDALKDPNTIMFTRKQAPAFETLRDEINRALDQQR